MVQLYPMTGIQAPRMTIPGLNLPRLNGQYWFSPRWGLLNPSAAFPADGADVQSWADRFGTGLTPAAPASTNRPIYRANALGGFPAVDFDGTDDYLVATIGASIQANINVYTHFSVVSSTGTGVRAICAEGNSGLANPAVRPSINVSANGRASHIHRDDVPVTAQPSGGTTANDGNLHLITIRRLAVNDFRVELDGVEVATATQSPGTTTVDRFAIGALVRNTIAQFWIDYIFEIAAYSGDVKDAYEQLFARYYGITLS